MHERPVTFRCEQDTLVGLLSIPDAPCQRGVLIVVGGPQYRVGAHRQFALLARSLAGAGIAVMRFDYRGMGDSQGNALGFHEVEDDIRAAADCFMHELPDLRDLVIWGLCDGASAGLLYAAKDARVKAVVLLNPWARTDGGQAKTTLKHYYSARLREPGLWRKIASGQFEFMAALRSLYQLAWRAAAGSASGNTLPAELLDSLRAFRGRVLLIMSGSDLTAREFSDMAAASMEWRSALADPRVLRHDLAGADHTCSRREWREQVNQWTCDWIRALPP